MEDAGLSRTLLLLPVTTSVHLRVLTRVQTQGSWGTRTPGRQHGVDRGAQPTDG
jgi:hypothetical protein